jgi:hypothetical protein
VGGPRHKPMGNDQRRNTCEVDHERASFERHPFIGRRRAYLEIRLIEEVWMKKWDEYITNTRPGRGG